jgi:hypothetical protein
MVNGWRVEIRDADRNILGPCDVWTSLKATIRHRKAGGWMLALPAAHPQAALFTEGGGAVVWAPWSSSTPLFSGAISHIQATAPSSTAPAMLSVDGVDDTGLLADRLALPDPASPMDVQDAAAYYTASGPSEWCVRKVVDVNAGLSALPVRRMCDADPGGKLAAPGSCAGSSAKVSARFDNLLTLIDQIASVDNLAVSLVQTPGGTGLVLLVAATEDRSATVRLSQPAGTITSGSLTVVAPRATHVLVAGGGEETARVFREVADTVTADQWRRIETFRDARDTTDPVVLVQRGQEALAETAPTGGATVEPVDVPTQRFGVHYNLGDVVGVDFGSVSWTEVVTAVTVDVSASTGALVRPILGDESVAAGGPAIYARVRDLTQRLDALERRQ